MKLPIQSNYFCHPDACRPQNKDCASESPVQNIWNSLLVDVQVSSKTVAIFARHLNKLFVLPSGQTHLGTFFYFAPIFIITISTLHTFPCSAAEVQGLSRAERCVSRQWFRQLTCCSVSSGSSQSVYLSCQVQLHNTSYTIQYNTVFVSSVPYVTHKVNRTCLLRYLSVAWHVSTVKKGVVFKSV